ncbi:MAG: VOC family protein [Thermoplasmata archaeon]|nr:VOC family protein [Thermoplasmata archaeon]
MADAWLCDAGIRVTDLDASIEFYTSLLDLVELKRAQEEDSAYVLFKDRRSGQRLELNWYSEKSPFYRPFVGGEGLDHLEVRVRSLATTLAKLKERGVEPVNRKLWVNPVAVEAMRSRPEDAAWLEKDVWVTSTGHSIAYVADPDGNLLCLYDHPEEDFDAPVPEHY